MAVKDVFDWDCCAAALADQEPFWVPGVQHGYHALTFGWLVGEVMRRVLGAAPDELLDATIRSVTEGEVRIGLPEAEHGRVAEMGPFVVDAEMAAAFRRPVGDGPSLPALVFGNPALLAEGTVNSAAWRSGVVPAANGHATARGLARLYGSLTGQDRLLGREAMRRCSEPAVRGQDLVLGVETGFSLGFMRGSPMPARRLSAIPARAARWGSAIPTPVSASATS